MSVVSGWHVPSCRVGSEWSVCSVVQFLSLWYYVSGPIHRFAASRGTHVHGRLCFPKLLLVCCHSQYVAISWGSLLGSFSPKAKALVTSFFCIPPETGSYPGPSSDKTEREKRSSGGLSCLPGTTAPLKGRCHCEVLRL